MATEARAPLGYAPELDGLRTVAVAAVAWSHWLPQWQFGVPFGAGVHLFFVLSGFLITRILLAQRAAPSRVAAVGRFFARRALRLFPAFYVVLACAWLADVPLARETWAWHAAYLSNVFIAGGASWQGHFSHFWSLAVEEQFYLVWPWIVLWAPGRALTAVLVLTALAGPVAHLLAASRGLAEPFWALVPAGSADSLAVGALVALGAWSDAAVNDGRWTRAALAGAAAGALVGLADARGGAPWWLAAWRQLAQALVFAWVVWRGVRGVDGATGRVLRFPAMIAIGRISYGVYLVHAFAPLVLHAGLGAMGVHGVDAWPAALRALAAWGTSLALAGLLWVGVEAPAHRWKARLREA